MILPHGVDRIEQMGSDAVVVGTDGKDLHFTSVRPADWPEIASRYTRKAAQANSGSHGFFYKPDGEDSGTLGLPINIPGRPGYRHLFEDSAAILFLRNDSLQFREVGELGAQPENAINDQCRASCVDWYGNASVVPARASVCVARLRDRGRHTRRWPHGAAPRELRAGPGKTRITTD